jgi:hypothetical protein
MFTFNESLLSARKTMTRQLFKLTLHRGIPSLEIARRNGVIFQTGSSRTVRERTRGNINVVGYVNLKSNIQNLVLGLHTTLVHYNKHIYVRIRLIFSRRLG